MGFQNQAFLTAHQWQVQFSYQYANTHELFVGDKRNDAAGPFGVPPHRKVLIYDLAAVYAVTNRFSVDLTVPYLSATGGTEQGTAQSHHFYEARRGGLGDITLGSNFYLSDPTKNRRASGLIGLAVKAPTGTDSATALNHNFNPPVERPIDEAFQPGAGGWVVLVRAQGSARIAKSMSAYAGGYYGISLTEHSKVIQNNAFRAVPDTYSARLGVAWLLPSQKRWSVSGGGRIFGVTVRDLVAGRDLHFRRPGYEVYFEPGLSWASTLNSVSVSVPVRVYQNKQDSLLDRSRHEHQGADFAPYLIILSYARRF